MAITRRDALSGAIACGLTGAARAAEKPPAADRPGHLREADRGRLEEAGPVIVKVFAAALRTRYTDEKAAELRKYIDPRYLKEHGLQEGAFPIGRVVTGDIYSNHLSDDPRTALIVVQTEDAKKECLLFRLTVGEGREVYIMPLSPPDKKTKAFNPWILRVKV